MAAHARIDVYSDTVCPWCYLGKRRFETALAARPQFEPQVIWRAFELNPDLPPEGVDRARHLAATVGDPRRAAETQASLTALGASVGIAFRFDLIERIPNTRRSHLLIALAGRRGRQAQVAERIMRAYFEEGCDIGDVNELVRLGVEAGLAEGEARNALVLRAGQDAVVATQRHATGLGITGVPTFVFDREYTVSGAQESDTLIRVFDQVAQIAASRQGLP
jgi:predicted DsbA family dithiol-disulfide isomerase